MGIVFGKTGVVEPVFESLLSRKDCTVPYEFRRYGKRFAIETLDEGDDKGAAFKNLAGYIGVFGTPQNEKNEAIAMTAPVVTSSAQKIDMTAPVVTSKNKEGISTMQFILPAEYDDLTKIPTPKSSKVTIQQLPPSVGVIHVFNGWVKEPKAREKVSQLVQQLNQDGMSDISESTALDNYLLWQYNPPFTIPQLRRNEVWIPLTEKQVKAHLDRYPEEKQ
eukprot:CAMPEP_0197836860 /NCGR_PEP_ID=MMETSP1437-20131217/30299_1 /TAXON_ID=49252 ORGANISM="Eucampia antarctica, Strain CCMP1452" /NCGR_SAMPLE_ID=MMETSP1437 /ASSEMBLY_ACC=CAM_ASM_001096 /LENGTH=219 /DNA_ID=CAMNT_0043443387 /DNA_START=71 /DNA_END=730 /DNA_ORIENTATION=+